MHKPSPDVANLPYGPYPRNLLDFWFASNTRPTPVFVWIHGGGFFGGDKSDVPTQLLKEALQHGISVASINYRFSQQAPFPAPFLDGGRAMQLLRFMRHDWKIDVTRIVAGGCSAGGGISLWLGYHADLADAASDDPIARESSRPDALACIATQSSYDPNFIKEIIPGPASLHTAMQLLFRVRVEEFDTAWARARFAEGSPITHVTAAAPPTLMFYDGPTLPLTEDLSQNAGIHHARFGEVLRDKLVPLGVPCEVKYREDYPDTAPEEMYDVYSREAIAFMREQLHC